MGVATLPPPPGDRGIAEIGLVAVKGEKKYIYPDGAAKGNLPFTPGILVGDTLYISGQASFDPKTGKLVEGDFKAHVKQTLKNIEAILSAGGRPARSSEENVSVEARCWPSSATVSAWTSIWR